MQSTGNIHNSLTLYELNSLVSDVVSTTMDREFWVQAELSEAREVRGHCYMDLIQKDIFNNTPVARASAKCWKSSWMTIRPRFERITGQTLHVGLKVLLLVKADFHPAYGFSWIVSDIDPTYTMGDMARKRMEIITQLKEEGVFDLQKQLHIPMFAQRIAVISSDNAAGYGDFCRQLSENKYGLVFSITLFPAVMQGDNVENSIIDALNAIYDSSQTFDVVVIIRGGGATSDLSGFDSLALAENVANFPLPIITGIGHERDESVLDMISNTRVKTPTAAAAFLIDNLVEVLSFIEESQDTIVTHVQHRMEVERLRISKLAGNIPMLFSVVKVRQGAKLDNLYSRLAVSVHERISDAMHHISILHERIQPMAERKLNDEHHRLMFLQQRMKAVDPHLLLKRGYSITLFHGKALKNSDFLKPGDEIDTLLEKGKIKSTVK